MKGDDIAARLLDLAVGVIEVVTGLPKRSPIATHIAGQLTRAGTAGGAHYAEARVSESRLDFAHKVQLGAKELHETAYWLTLADRLRLTPHLRIREIIDEAEQLSRILRSSGVTASRGARGDTGG